MFKCWQNLNLLELSVTVSVQGRAVLSNFCGFIAKLMSDENSERMGKSL